MSQALIDPEEQADLKMLWLPKDKWVPYMICHMTAIRAKFFPEQKP